MWRWMVTHIYTFTHTRTVKGHGNHALQWLIVTVLRVRADSEEPWNDFKRSWLSNQSITILYFIRMLFWFTHKFQSTETTLMQSVQHLVQKCSHLSYSKTVKLNVQTLKRSSLMHLTSITVHEYQNKTVVSLGKTTIWNCFPPRSFCKILCQSENENSLSPLAVRNTCDSWWALVQ